jgi:iron complex outermembrane receptor protein
VSSMSTTGKLGAQYDVTDSTMAYVQWQSGFKAAGYNFSICGNQFHPEEIRAWEGGLKGRYFGGRLTLYASVFYYDYTNMQLYRVTGVSAIVDNAGRSTLYGAELEGAAQLTDRLKADWAVSWLHARYDVYSAINTALPQPSPQEDLSGNTMIKSPDYTLRLGLEYRAPLGNLGSLTLRGEIFHSDTVFFTAFDEDISKQGPYTLENIFLTSQPNNAHYRVSAFVKNLGDKAYLLSGYTLGAFFPNSGYGMYGDPRTFGVEVSARF